MFVIGLAEECEENCKRLVEADGLIGGLIRVIGKDGEGFMEARVWAVVVIWMIALCGSDEVKKGLFEYDGLVDCLLGKMRNGVGVEREYSLFARKNIAGGDTEVKKGLFKHEGLIDGLIEIAGQTGDEYEDARDYAVEVMENIADGDDEVKAGLFHFPGLMTSIEVILLDETLNGTSTKRYATELADKLLQWQRQDSATLTFKTYTIMLKLCSKKLTRSGRRMRATPYENSPHAVFFHNNSDVAKHILSFLDTHTDEFRQVASHLIELRE
jgi:hypothetical protein